MNFDLSRSELEHIIDEWIIGKSAIRNRRILKMRLCDGITYEKLAEMEDLSVRQIKNIVYKGEQKILKHIDN